MHRLALAALLLASGCACAPSYHDETTYAGPTFAASIESCAKGIQCTTLCARAFFRDQGSIDSCRVVSRDADGGATIEMTYHELTCEVSDEGWDWGTSDDGDYSDDSGDYDPCSDGSCDPPPDEDPPPDDPPPDDPPPDDPPPDEDPPMDETPP